MAVDAGSRDGSASTGSSTSRADVARGLTRIWQGLLHISSIGLDDNYFDLGGDSQLAVQLFAQVEKVFGVKLPLAVLFEAPTVRQLAELIRTEAATSHWSCLVPIQPKGSRAPLFCMHGAGGNVLVYRDLARHLGPEQPVYGLQSYGLDGSCAPLSRIAEMAALYLKEIRRLQPSGPYFLGGYCLGGTIAFEVAQQLRAAGEEVGLLAMFDTMNWSKVPPRGFWGKSHYKWEKLVFHAGNFLLLDFAGKRRFFSEKVKVLKSRIPVWRGMFLAKFRKNSPAAAPEATALGKVWQANDRAAFQYVPRRLDGVVTDFRPMKQYRIFGKPEYKWDHLAERGNQVVVLPVYPAGMLVEPFVQHLAASLKEMMERQVERRDEESRNRP